VIASDIEGSIGLLGEDYTGYYPVENTQVLTELLLRAEKDKLFYQQLEQSCIARQAMFTPESELNGWRKLLKKL
jgi:glycosyltransferase involved in cell wall biosynthesis